MIIAFESETRVVESPTTTPLLLTPLATFRRKNVLFDIGRVTLHATDIVFRGDFARVHSRARSE